MHDNMRSSARQRTSHRISSDRTSAVVPQKATKTKKNASEKFSTQLRPARERAGLTVRELARRVGVSPSLISQVERGLATPSVGTLLMVAKELGLEIGDLFKFGNHWDRTASSPVQRRSSRKTIRLASGVSWERLTSVPDSEVEFLYAVYNVGSASCEEDSMTRHGGKEYGYLVSGRLGVKIGFEEYELGPGDAITFDAQSPHRLWCIGDRPAVAIWAVVRRQQDPRQAPDHAADSS